MTAGYNTISMGTGRKEFHPKKPRPGLEDYFREAGQGTLAMIGGGAHVDECVVGNFMAGRFVRQAHLNAFFPMIDKDLRFKPATRVEGACASGGLALLSGIRSVLAGTADVVLALGIDVQNSVKAVYGADFLALASWFPNRKQGHAFSASLNCVAIRPASDACLPSVLPLCSMRCAGSWHWKTVGAFA